MHKWWGKTNWIFYFHDYDDLNINYLYCFFFLLHVHIVYNSKLEYVYALASRIMPKLMNTTILNCMPKTSKEIKNCNCSNDYSDNAFGIFHASKMLKLSEIYEQFMLKLNMWKVTVINYSRKIKNKNIIICIYVV